ncbi:MAG: acyl carrier protein [Candidatus Electrothrix sp. AU1_5]|nr:acyl carrier protein [Candidatus Electrothrix gigas]
MHILDDIGFDSLQLLDFVLRIEEVFDIEFDFEDFDYSHFNSIETFTRFTVKHIKAFS